METLPKDVQTIDLREPIPGYLLGERLGAGGFGEVWRATAPGGLAKAVKIVYGHMQGDRAAQELKALQRIKEVRHPMLLSLERIESVAENLVIVMELADGSLRDRLAEKEAAGLLGIPREDLLVYLRDAADAMDYLVEHHSLLHLDIKPENLLLVADRVKVAEFGLMRELGDVNSSLIGAMTPLYAAPELFDGTPHRHSDQYSLAVVYQELLSGQPPFAGRTPAQLISQHLHSQPNLKSLPTCDQPIIARALSKVAERRFPNCRALIEELVDAPRAVERTQPRRTPGDAAQGDRSWRGAGCTTTRKLGGLPETDLVSFVYPVSTDVRNLPPIKLQADPVYARPTLFVGVGEMGTRVLCDLKQQLCNKFGNVDEIPAMQFLALETDPQTFAQVSSESNGGGLRFHELLHLPLKNPQDYRAKSSLLLEWMNRRWLYNIPRSRTTEGIRALGRLAFVDHFGLIVDALHTALATAIAPDSLEVTTRRTGLNFSAGPPRVFVVGSTTGGTGSGMLLDLGYTLRTLFKKMEIADEQLCGILTCATPLRAKARDLAVANTVALLGELKQFSGDRYPGEPACDLPAFEGQAPFANTYFLYLGESPDETAFRQSAADISNYLLLSTVTRAASFFEQCRDESNATGHQEFAVTRTFGMSRTDCQATNIVSSGANVLAGALFTQWAQYDKDPRQSNPPNRNSVEAKAHALAEKFSEMFGLTETRTVEEGVLLIREELGQDTRQFIHKSLNDIWMQSLHLKSDERIRDAVETVDQLIGASRELSTAAHAKSLSAMLDRQLVLNSQQTRVALQDWLAKLVDTPALRVVGARYACSWLIRHFEQLERAASEQLDRLMNDISRLQSSLQSAGSDHSEDTKERTLVGMNSKVFRDFFDYATAMLHITIYRRSNRARQLMREVLLDTERRLRSLSQSLQVLADEFPKSTHDLTANLDPAKSRQYPSAFQNRLPQLVVTLDRALERTHLGQLLVMDELAKGGVIDLENLSRSVVKHAETVLRRHFQGVAAAELDEQGSYDTERLKECVNRALPHLISYGGAKRALVILPTNGGLDAATLSQDARLAEE
ncbi:MAG: hypothetical protein CMJ50_10635 [Planctomycetaceae bacterium]|nr:hypothetical protein [Planctomycetaceae bacterium]